MKDLTNINNVREILGRHGFQFTKALGQNFLIDSEVPARIVRESGIDKSCGVIEVGPGMGTLTAQLSEAAAKVVSVELDKTLAPVLKETLSGHDNIKIIYDDILKIDIGQLITEEFNGLKVAVCANLPYYITTPVIMHLLENKFPLESITVMVQKEVALRLTAKPSTAEYGAVTLTVNYYTEPEILFYVPAESFIPRPSVDSAMLKLVLRKSPPVTPYSTKFMFDIIKGGFAHRRKTLANSLHNAMPHILPREICESALEECGIARNIRGEALSLVDFSNLSDILGKKIYK